MILRGYLCGWVLHSDKLHCLDSLSTPICMMVSGINGDVGEVSGGESGIREDLYFAQHVWNA